MLNHAASKLATSPAGVLLLIGSFLLMALSPLPVRGQGGKKNNANVRDFGAVGDGVADDTAALQRAVDEGNGQVRFPSGVYKLTKPLVVDLTRVGLTSLSGRGTVRLLMAGPGPAIRIIGGHEGTAAPHTLKDAVWLKERMPLIDGLEIMGAHPEACGIESRGAIQLTISRVTVRRALHGIHLVVRNRNVVISECHIYDNRGVGVFLDNVNLHQFNMANTHVSYCDGGGVVVRGGSVRNIHIGTCDIEGNMGADGPPTANILFDCAQGSVAEAAIVGCTIQHTHKAPDSANIRILGRGKRIRKGVKGPANFGNITIANNVLSDVQVNIDLDGVRGVAITGNTMWKGFSHQLRIRNSTQLTIASNVLDRNPQYQELNDSQDAVLIADSSDVVFSGNQINGERGAAAGVVIERCRRFNIFGTNIFDCDGPELILRDVKYSRLAGCILRDDREEHKHSPPLVLIGGEGNMIQGNHLSRLAVEKK